MEQRSVDSGAVTAEVLSNLVARDVWQRPVRIHEATVDDDNCLFKKTNQIMTSQILIPAASLTAVNHLR
jgi:hypothetical protein